MTATHYPKRLIEVDLPIRQISAHAHHESFIRHGHINTLHLWWARRPLPACRAVLCASLWLDPADVQCPQDFRDATASVLCAFAERVRTDKQVMELCASHWPRWNKTDATTIRSSDPACWVEMRRALLDFIADFASWKASSVPAFLDAARMLTRAAHEAVGGTPSTHPLVADPFAGGGAIPLEASRIGADVFASDLNPLPVLLNKLVLEYLPRYGARLAEEVRKCGARIGEQAMRELIGVYPADEDGATPIAYMWARTVRCEGPGCGATIPLITSLWLAKRRTRMLVLEPEKDREGKRLHFKVVKAANPKAVGAGTVRGGAANCPFCDFTTPNPRVRAQLAERHGGAADAQLLAVVLSKPTGVGRHYRAPNDRDLAAVRLAAQRLRELTATNTDLLSPVPDEPVPKERPSPNARGLSAVTRMGIRTFGDLYTPRQALALATLARLVRSVPSQARPDEADLSVAVQICMGLALDRVSEMCSSLARWNSSPKMETLVGTFARQALPIVWDFPEQVPFRNVAGSWAGAIDWIALALEEQTRAHLRPGLVQQVSATEHPLADDSVQALVTDPPYYDSVPYADLSDYFYVWLRRSLGQTFPDLFGAQLSPKDEEAIWNPSRVHAPTNKPKDKEFYEHQMTLALREGRRITMPGGIGVIVFAHKSTSGWEAVISAILKAGWTVTASWPIDTEMATRVNAVGTASLASSVHLVCRPREAPDVTDPSDDVGSWRTVLAELPARIHDWMPRLAREGVVGADAIFACLGPALELFSRFSRVEKASGDVVALREYLEHVWAAVSKEALSMIFEGADSSGLEEDARLTAMWLWTLSTSTPAAGGRPEVEAHDELVASDDDDDAPADAGKALAGFVMEFDAARKIAQGLGAHLEKLTNVVEVKKDKARLLAVAERAKALFTKESASSDAATAGGKGKSSKMQLGLFAEIEAAEKDGLLGEAGVPHVGKTTLDRIHQAMILFGAGRSEALKRFLIEEGVGKDTRFWRLAQSLSALYPSGSDEKRWVDGVLARKKSLGF